MYGMYYLVQVFGVPYWAAAPLTILLVAALGAALHYIVIAPLLTAPPINQLLATGGVLFILQSFATVAFGHRLPATSASACRYWRSARCISATRGCCRLPPP